MGLSSGRSPGYREVLFPLATGSGRAAAAAVAAGRSSRRNELSNHASRRQQGRRRHRPRATAAPSGPTPDIDITSFTDALAEAAALVEEFGRAFAGFVVDSAGHVISGWALTADHHAMEDVVLLVLAGKPPAPGTGVVLMSADRDGDVMSLKEEDELKWRSFSRVLAARGFHLWDWIQADGEAFRSMHFASGTSEEWPAPSAVLAKDPLEENHDDQ